MVELQRSTTSVKQNLCNVFLTSILRMLLWPDRHIPRNHVDNSRLIATCEEASSADEKQYQRETPLSPSTSFHRKCVFASVWIKWSLLMRSVANRLKKTGKTHCCVGIASFKVSALRYSRGQDERIRLKRAYAASPAANMLMIASALLWYV